jgi:hypothetical protein
MGKFPLRRAECGVWEVEWKGIDGMTAEGSGRNVEAPEPGGYTRLLGTGESTAGEFHCSECGYGVIVQRTPPRCPMCSGTAWEPAGLGALRRRTTGLVR